MGLNIAIVGRPGSGKTTLARRLAQTSHLQHIELDQLFWQKNWVGTPSGIFRTRVTEALSREGWVTDNTFIEVRDIVWKRATIAVWLDYPLWLCTWRFLRRTWHDYFYQAETWGGNRFQFRALLVGEPPLLWWMWHTYHTRPRNYPKLFTQPDYTHLQVVHLPTPTLTNAWLREFQKNDYPK